MWIATIPTWSLCGLALIFGFACFMGAINLMNKGQAKAGWYGMLFCVLSFILSAAAGAASIVIWRL